MQLNLKPFLFNSLSKNEEIPSSILFKIGGNPFLADFLQKSFTTLTGYWTQNVTHILLPTYVRMYGLMPSASLNLLRDFLFYYFPAS